MEEVEVNTPIDRTHEECLHSVNVIRFYVGLLRESASAWQPSPMPKGWSEKPTNPRSWKPRRSHW